MENQEQEDDLYKKIGGNNSIFTFSSNSDEADELGSQNYEEGYNSIFTFSSNSDEDDELGSQNYEEESTENISEIPNRSLNRNSENLLGTDKTNEAGTSGTIVDEIPAVTIKTSKKAITNSVNNFTDKKVLPLRIIDIKTSETVPDEVNVFKVMDIRYKYVRICGNVVSVNRKEDGASFRVDDGTGFIYCILKDDTRLAQKVDHLSKICENDNRENCSVEDNNDPDLNSLTEMFLRQTKKLLSQYPSSKELKIGDMVTVVGKVVNFDDINDKTIFTRRVRRENDTETYLKHITEISGIKNNYYKKLEQQKNEAVN